MAVTQEQVAELYVAFFDRAPDAAGLAYWVDESGLEIEEISQSFFDQDETKTKYPDSLTDAVFVDTIYQNVFNRASDPDGLDYWVKELQAGNISRAEMILAVTNGAQDTALGNDQTTLDNKTEVGLYYAAKGLDDVTEATNVMADVDDTEASVLAAKSIVDDASSLDLTTNKDTLVGTPSDDTFHALDTTYTAGDNLDGGEGNDTLALKIAATFTDPNATLNNIENVVVTQTAAQTLSAANWSGVENYTFNKVATNAVKVTDIATAPKTLTESGLTAASPAQFTVATDTYSGDNDTVHFTLASSTNVASLSVFSGASTSTTQAGVENFVINSTGNSGSAGVTLDAETKLKTVTVTGDSAIALTTNPASTSLEKVDASALTGALSYTTTTTTNPMTVIGSSKNDTLVDGVAGVKNVIAGGSGSDTITAFKTTVQINYKDDSGVTTSTADIINAFTSGTDSIKIVGVGAGDDSNFVEKTTSGATAVNSIEKAVAQANSGDIAGKKYFAYDDGTDSYLTYDIDGDGVVDGAMKLSTFTGLVATDII